MNKPRVYFAAILVICLYAVTLSAQNVISGKITNNANNAALAGATVYFPDIKTGAVSQEDGTYTIKNIPSGSYVVEVSFIGFATQSKSIKTKGNIAANFSLAPSVYQTKEVVITGTLKALERQHSPQPITEVTNEYLAENSSTNVIDAIATTSGVSGMTDGQSITKPIIRGLGYNRVLTLSDGVELMDQAWFDEFGIEADPAAVDRYEILKGPGSLAYGSDAIAGVVNLIPEKPLPDGQAKGDVLFNYQTNNGLISNSVHLAGNKNGLAWSARIDNTMAHAYQDPYDGYVLNSQFSNFNADGTIGIHRGWGYSQLHASYFDMASGIVDGTRDSATGLMERQIAIPGVDGGQGAGVGGPFYVIPSNQELKSYTPFVINQRIRHTKLVWDNSYNLGNGQVKAIFSYQKNQRQETNDPTMMNTPDIYYYSNAFTFDAKYISPQIKGFNYSIGGSGATQFSQSLGTLMLIPNYNFFQIGGFAIGTQKIGNLYLSGGIRYDTRTFNGLSQWIDSTTQIPVQSTAPNAFHEFQSFNTKFSGLSGSFGATYDLTKDVYVKGNIARGYRAPNVAECGANGVHDGTVVYELGNHNLNPETSLEEDVTFGMNAKDISFEIDGFVNIINDFIYAQGLQSANGGDSMNYSLAAVFGGVAAPVFKYEQTKAQLYGGEVTMDIHPSTLPWFEFNSTLSTVDGGLMGVPDSIKYLPFVPPTRITSEIKFHFKNIGSRIKNAYLKIGLLNESQQNHIYLQTATYTGLTTASTPYEYAASTAATKGYTLFNVGFGGDVLSKGKELCQVYLICNNLLNKGYMDYMSRFKYYPVNYTTDRVGVFNMGRNLSIKIIVPFDIK